MEQAADAGVDPPEELSDAVLGALVANPTEIMRSSLSHSMDRAHFGMVLGCGMADGCVDRGRCVGQFHLAQTESRTGVEMDPMLGDGEEVEAALDLERWHEPVEMAVLTDYPLFAQSFRR